MDSQWCGLGNTKIYELFSKLEMEFKEFKPRFKNGWFHLKLYQMFQDLGWHLNLNWVLADLHHHGLNSLNSFSGCVNLDYLILWFEI